MLEVSDGSPSRNCQGISRRTALQVGALGLTGLNLPNLLRSQALGASSGREKSCILVWLDGGPSQIESYDPKPEAPLEYRGPFNTISTRVAGTQFCELLPAQARVADKISVVRSVHHNTGDHFAGAHWMLTGRFGSNAANTTPKFPSFSSYISRLKGTKQPGFPASVGLPAAESVYIFPGYHGAAYLGQAYNPFDVDTESKYLHHSYNVPVGLPRCFSSMAKIENERSLDRQSLLQSLDKIERSVDQTRVMDSMDRYQQDAMAMVLSPHVARAFDIDKEDPRLSEKYGNNPWGRYTLMSRRLVEAGVRFVTVDMPHWDHHSSLVQGHAPNMRKMDQAVGALIEDLDVRGLLEDTLVVVMGEFGRTPKINTGLPNDPIPGRDHWGEVFSVMLAGGGLRGGVVVGQSNSKAETPIERGVGPHDILATIYRVMGVDPTISFRDHSGRPIPILPEGEAISELVS